MNTIYDQVGGTCSGFAIANAIEKAIGKAPTPDQVYALYKKHDLDKREGMRLFELFEILKTEPLNGTRVDAYKELYNKFKRTKPKTEMNTIREALFKLQKNEAIIFNIIIRVGKPNLPLNSDFILTPKTDSKIKTHHAVFIIELNKKGFKVENSWGEKWGEKGYFYLSMGSFYTEVHSAYIVKFR